MLGHVDSEPRPRAARRGELDNRLAALRARLWELKERRQGTEVDQAAFSKRLEAAKRHAAEAHAAVVHALASSVKAFSHSAEAHERLASLHEKAVASGAGDVSEHERQAALQRTAAAEDRQRAERAQSALSKPEWAGPAPISDQPADGTPPQA